MNNESIMLLLVAAIGATLFQAPSASACSLQAWSSVSGSPVASGPDQPPTVARYAGRCAMQADAIGDFVTDTSPADETGYRVRFYVYTGNHSGGLVDIFQARNASGTNLIRVQYSGTQLVFSMNGTAISRSASVAAERWYSIELAWAASTSGSLSMIVQGAGSATPFGIAPITAINNASDRIASARLGKLAGAGSGFMNFDAFASSNSTSPGRLLRGDANGNGVVNIADVIAIRNEALVGTLADGQPDCNENGDVNVTDVVCTRNIALGL
jgi:hypothetical protein